MSQGLCRCHHSFAVNPGGKLKPSCMKLFTPSGFLRFSKDFRGAIIIFCTHENGIPRFSKILRSAIIIVLYRKWTSKIFQDSPKFNYYCFYTGNGFPRFSKILRGAIISVFFTTNMDFQDFPRFSKVQLLLFP